MSPCIKYVQLECEFMDKVSTIRMWVHVQSMCYYNVSSWVKYVQLECEYMDKVCTIRMWVLV